MPRLILTRKLGEVIRLGADIIVRVEAISIGRVKLSIEAPLDVEIRREPRTPLAPA